MAADNPPVRDDGAMKADMSGPVQLVFRGEVLAGFEVADVRRRMAVALKLDEERLAQLFSGGRTVIKRSIEPALARTYVDKLAQLGALVHQEPSDDPPTTAFPTLPEVPEDDGSPAVPPWGLPPLPSRPAPLSPYEPPAAPAPIPVKAAPAAPAPATEQVTCPNCGERQSKRLLCRKCATNIEMALASKQAEANQEREERLAAMQLREARRAGVAEGATDAPGYFGFSLDGRIGRLRYATGNTVSLALWYMPIIMWLQRPTLGRLAFVGLASLLLTAVGQRAAVLRCHDCDKSGWWSMLLWLPGVYFIVALVLAVAPGTNGTNEYGEPPPPSSGWAFGAAVLSALLLLALTFSNVWKAYERMAIEGDDEDMRIEFQADPRAGTLPSADARAAFNESYLAARSHKAFAASPSGGWGWASGLGSPGEAAQRAVLECESRRPPYTAACELVNVNGQWGGGP
jgi:uncharacterized membrane protein YhaH (DUF805 family)